MHTYFVSYRVESVGQMFQKTYRRSTLIEVPMSAGTQEGRALLLAQLAVEIHQKFGFQVEDHEDIWIASLTLMGSRPYGGGQ